MEKKIIAIIGCGAIGTALAEYADAKMGRNVAGIIVFDADPGKSAALSLKMPDITVAGSIEDAFDKADLVVEAAVAGAVPGIMELALRKNRDVMIMSIGGILGMEKMFEAAREKGIRVLLPSGAIAGVDALKSARIAGIESVTITTRKPPRSVAGAPYLLEKGIDTDAIKEETVIFEGSAREAMRGFPRNINVSALLSIAGIGADDTTVRIIVSPGYDRNSHEVEVLSGAGKIITRTENVPSPANPKTSYLAALAAMAALEGYFDTIRIGT
jgi:aspartate dehydrogenase